MFKMLGVKGWIKVVQVQSLWKLQQQTNEGVIYEIYTDKIWSS